VLQITKEALLVNFGNSYLFVLHVNLFFIWMTFLDIWAQLMKWSLMTLAYTPIWNLQKFLKLNILLHNSLSLTCGLLIFSLQMDLEIFVYTIIFFTMIYTYGKNLSFFELILNQKLIFFTFTSKTMVIWKSSPIILKFLWLTKDMRFHLWKIK